MRENDSETHTMKEMFQLIGCTVASLILMIFIAASTPVKDDSSELNSMIHFVEETTTSLVTTTTHATRPTITTTKEVSTTTTIMTSDVDIMASISTPQSSEMTTKDIATSTTTIIVQQHRSPNNATVRPVIPDCTLADDIQQYIYDTCVSKNIEYELVMAIMFFESGYNPNASNGTCFGLMQLHKCNSAYAASLGVTNLFDPRGNALVGISLLADLREKYNMTDALICYGWGEYGARGLLGTIPPYVQKLIDKYYSYLSYL